MQLIDQTEMLQSIESYCTAVLGYDRAEAYLKLESGGQIQIWLYAGDEFIQKAPYDDRVLQISTYETASELDSARALIWNYLYTQAKPRAEREFAFAMRRMAILADSQFSTFVGQFIAGQMKKAIEDAGRLLEGPGPRSGPTCQEESPQEVVGPTEELFDDEPF